MFACDSGLLSRAWLARGTSVSLAPPLGQTEGKVRQLYHRVAELQECVLKERKEASFARGTGGAAGGCYPAWALGLCPGGKQMLGEWA